MKGESLEIVNHHPYLGVELSDSLNYHLHIDNICKKASSVLGFLKQNLKHFPPKVKERAYRSLVRPKVEYATPIWNPQQKTQIKQVEQIQQNAARFVKNQPYNPEKPDSVTSILNGPKPQLEHPRTKKIHGRCHTHAHVQGSPPTCSYTSMLYANPCNCNKNKEQPQFEIHALPLQNQQLSTFSLP